MKLLYAVAFALFPWAATAQTLNSSLLAALCQDDYFEDTAGQCSIISSGEVLTIEAILERYSTVVVTLGTDEGLAGVFHVTPEDAPVGSTRSQQSCRETGDLEEGQPDADDAIQHDTIASQIVTPEPQLATGAEDRDDIATTGPTTRRIPTSSARSFGDEKPTLE